jgi:hypothetical protein
MESTFKIICDSTNNTPESITERKLTVDIYTVPESIIRNIGEGLMNLMKEQGRTDEECKLVLKHFEQELKREGFIT